MTAAAEFGQLPVIRVFGHYALAALLLPVLVLGAAVALYVAIEGRRHGVPASTVEKSETLSATSADAKVDIERHAQGATTVTTYTITGRY
jgi:hypothetical protein